MKTVARRLRRLEERLRPSLRAIAAIDPAGTGRLRGALAAAGFVAGPVESLAEVWAFAAHSIAGWWRYTMALTATAAAASCSSWPTPAAATVAVPESGKPNCKPNSATALGSP